MNDAPLEPHPLDADEPFDYSHPLTGGRTKVVRPLLKACVVALVICAGVAFLSGVMMSNSPPNSTAEATSYLINRISVVLMLIAFCGILIAYRLPHLGNVELSEKPMYGLRSDYSYLILWNVVAACLILGFELMIAPWIGAVAFTLITIPLCIFVALLVTMIIWHTGFMRAYAVGVLTVLGLQVATLMGLLTARVYGQFGGRGVAINWQLALLLITALMAGVVCAGYVKALTVERSK